MKSSLPILVLIFWISSWFPTSADIWAVVAAATFIIVMLGVISFENINRQYNWFYKALSVFGASGLIVGGFLVLLSFVLGTDAESAIAMFYFAGFAAYHLLLRKIIQVGQTSRSYFGIGFVALILLSAWSWTSAIAMYFHRGASTETDAACILVPLPYRYETELNNVWKMRLPEVVAFWTGPTGTIVLDYHAILVAPNSGNSSIYNWSKKWMRFEVLDARRNPHLPSECPKT